MSATGVVTGVGVGLTVAVIGLWLLQQHERGHRARARTAGLVIGLVMITATALADDGDLDESTRLTDLGAITPPPMWRVDAGDHYWRIAQATVASRGEPPTVERVDPYWRRLVAFNQRIRIDPALDPDVLHIGDLVWLPDPDELPGD